MTKVRLVAPLVLACVLAACSSKKPPKPIAVTPEVRDTPMALRNTLGARGTLRGITPTIVSGYGLVVDLNGTGGGDLDARLQQTMERMMGLQGVGKHNPIPGTALENREDGTGVTPRELLRDPNTAVVVVQAAVPPGAPTGYAFDVYVRAVNGTSLEGGRLWTTDLNIGLPTTFGGFQTKQLAKARGPVFVNAFAEPGAQIAGVDPTIGRVLDGGRVSEPLQIEMVLENPSPVLARRIVDAINSRFPEGPGDTGPVARGRSAESIAITIPSDYRERPGDFVNILEHITIDRRFPDQMARLYIDSVKENPGLADELSWCLVGLGEPAVRQLGGSAGLYDHPQLLPRLAGLRAGAMLGDPRAAVELEKLAREAPSRVVRAEAITLLAMLDAGPKVDMALRELAAEPSLEVRVAAYEGLAERAEQTQFARLVRRELQTASASSMPTSRQVLEARARAFLSANSMQGVGRALIEGKFFLDRVAEGEGLTYVTQQGVPRIVLFGEQARLNKPMFVRAWSDRLLIISESDTDPIRIRYQDLNGVVTEGQVEPSLAELIWFMAHETTPEDTRPGLGMSYSEVVGALYEIHEQGATDAAFATEQDRLMAALLEASRDLIAVERPETNNDRPRLVPEDRPDEIPDPGLRTTPNRVPKVVPIVGGSDADDG